MVKICYLLLGSVSVISLQAVIIGLIVAIPWGLIGFIALIGLGLLFFKVLSDRISSKEDDYYDKNVNQ